MNINLEYIIELPVKINAEFRSNTLACHREMAESVLSVRLISYFCRLFDHAYNFMDLNL